MKGVLRYENFDVHLVRGLRLEPTYTPKLPFMKNMSQKRNICHVLSVFRSLYIYLLYDMTVRPVSSIARTSDLQSLDHWFDPTVRRYFFVTFGLRHGV